MRRKFNERRAHRDANAGMYLLRTSLCQWDEVRITRLYWTLSDVEATFRTLKSELGLRPVYHRTLRCIRAHLFISELACQTVHYLRLTMRTKGERHSWPTIRRRLASINRITTELIDADGDRIQVRQNTHPDVQQRKLLSAMGVMLWISQQTGRWSDGVEVTKVVF